MKSQGIRILAGLTKVRTVSKNIENVFLRVFKYREIVELDSIRIST